MLTDQTDSINSLNEVFCGFKINAECVGVNQHRHFSFYDIKLNYGCRINKIMRCSREIALAMRVRTKFIVKTIPESGIVRLQTSHKKDYNKRKHTIKYRLRQLKRSAAKRNIEFSLRPEDIVIPEYCPVLGIKLSLTNTKVANNSPSVDRFDNNKGYVKDNVRVISYRANVLKRDATIEELEAVIRYMKS